MVYAVSWMIRSHLRITTYQRGDITSFKDIPSFIFNRNHLWLRQAGALPEIKQKPEAGPLSRAKSLIPGALLSYLAIDDSRI
jgi:hypothetical protein